MRMACSSSAWPVALKMLKCGTKAMRPLTSLSTEAVLVKVNRPPEMAKVAVVSWDKTRVVPSMLATVVPA